MYIHYNNNANDELPVDALMESPMQELHFESLWMSMLYRASLHTDTFDSM
jgi:hypothetical protein